MSLAWESVLAEIEEKLLTLSAPRLNDVCEALSVIVKESDKDLPRKLRRLILEYLESEDVTSQEDEGMTILLTINDTIDEIKGKRDGCDEPQAKQIEQRRDIDGTAPNSPDDGRECNPAPNVTKSATVSEKKKKTELSTHSSDEI